MIVGVSIRSKNGVHSFDCGYGGFYNLRKNIAYCISVNFGKLYENALQLNSDDHDKDIQLLNSHIAEFNLDEKYADVIDFLFESDCVGKINYKTCKHIYDLIKDVDFGKKCFRYGAYAHNDYEEFKEFLLDCYSHRKNMYWS